jgi:hypothetical protein
MCRRGPSDRVPRARGCVSSIESGPRRGVSSLYTVCSMLFCGSCWEIGSWDLGRETCVFSCKCTSKQNPVTRPSLSSWCMVVRVVGR